MGTRVSSAGAGSQGSPAMPALYDGSPARASGMTSPGADGGIDTVAGVNGALGSPPVAGGRPDVSSPMETLPTVFAPALGSAITRKEVEQWDSVDVLRWASSVAGLGDADAKVVGKYRGRLLLKVPTQSLLKLLSGEGAARIEAALVRDEWGVWPSPPAL